MKQYVKKFKSSLNDQTRTYSAIKKTLTRKEQKLSKQKRNNYYLDQIKKYDDFDDESVLEPGVEE